MAEPARFLNAFAQAVSTMVLYRDGHPARERAIDASYDLLRGLQEVESRPIFSFLGPDVVYGERTLRELKEWDWGTRLAEAGIQRLEFQPGVTREEYEEFLEEVLARLMYAVVDTAGQRPASGQRRASIRFGAVGVRGATGEVTRGDEEPMPTATIRYTLGEEAEAVRWMHEEVSMRSKLPLIEAEAVVRSLSVAMHADREIVLPLLSLKEFDQYTTTHSINVSVLAMGLAEYLGLGARDVRAFGVAGLLHDLGKVRVPKDILNKPGRLTEGEFEVMRKHPIDGAKLIVESDRQLDLAAAVAYEHHMMLNGEGYPPRHFCRACHQASRLVHVCDVYDALRTNRPYRAAWSSEKALEFIESRAGDDFDPDIVRAFGQMMKQWEGRVAVLAEDEEVPKSTPAPAGGASSTTAAPSAPLATATSGAA